MGNDGDRRVTSTDIAAAAGVSQATVSRVLSGSTAVKPSTREAVMRALDEAGYTPHAGARAMRTRRTDVIGVVAAHITNPFYPHLLEELSTSIHAAGRRMILWDGRMDGERSAVTAIREGAVDCVVFTSATRTSAVLTEAVSKGLPVVLVNRTVSGLACDRVTSSNAAGGTAVVRYLHAAGRRKLAVIAGQRGVSTSADRLRGFRSTASDLGLPTPKVAVAGSFEYEDGARAMVDLLREPDLPDAVFCINDVLAFGAIDAARAAGVRVPEDVWVVGYDDIAIAGWGAYDLTTVRQPIADMARQSIEFALERIESPDRAPRTASLPSELIIRGSSANFHP